MEKVKAEQSVIHQDSIPLGTSQTRRQDGVGGAGAGYGDPPPPELVATISKMGNYWF